MKAVADSLVLFLIWSAVGYRTWTLIRRPREPVTWAFWRALVTLACAVSLFTPSIYHSIYRLTGVLNIAEYVGHAFILISGWQASALLLHLVYRQEPARARRMIRARGALVLASVLVAGFFFSLIPTHTNTTKFTTEYAYAPYIIQYWITFLTAVNLLLADLVRLVARYASKTSRDPLRIGLRFIASGVAVGIMYWIHWVLFFLLRDTTGAPGWLTACGTISSIASVLLIVLGSTIPALGRLGLRAPATMWHERRLWRRLQPLWLALTTEFPDIALPDKASGDAHLPYRLYRRRVEVLDGMLALQPYRDPATERRAMNYYQSKGLDDSAVEVAVEAAGIDHALRARRAAAPSHEKPVCQHGRIEDSVWLARIGTAFAQLQHPSARPWDRQVNR